MAEGEQSNPQFRRYWNQEGGNDWLHHRRRFDAMFQPLHEAVLAALAPRSGERILDVGCGPGELTLDVAVRVGPGGEAMGVDLSAPLLDVARREADQAGSSARFVLADAQTMDLRPLAPLDAWTSRLGVMFFDDAPTAFSNLCDALVPGGRVAFVCWAPFADNPWMSVPMGALMSTLPPRAPSPPPAVDPWAFGEVDRLLGLLEGLPVEHPEVHPVDLDVTLAGGGTAAEVVAWLCSLEAVAPMLSDVAPGDADRAQQAVVEVLEPHERAGAVVLPGRGHLVTVRRR